MNTTKIQTPFKIYKSEKPRSQTWDMPNHVNNLKSALRLCCPKNSHRYSISNISAAFKNGRKGNEWCTTKVLTEVFFKSLLRPKKRFAPFSVMNKRNICKTCVPGAQGKAIRSTNDRWHLSFFQRNVVDAGVAFIQR